MVKTALCRPNPPSDNGSAAIIFALDVGRTQDSTKALPTAIVVMGGTIKGQFRIDGPQEEVGFSCSAEQEEKPSCLYQKAGILSKSTQFAAVFSANLCTKFPGSSHPAVPLAKLGLLSRRLLLGPRPWLQPAVWRTLPVLPNELKCVHGGKVPPARSRERE